ncbi:MAG TPA: hypothetical protein VFF29_00015, partial [Bacteroidota bacterium]|nr:hypothetical protein [Bacteroidota bacterium]
MKKLLLFLIVINYQLFTQDRYLVSPYGDVVPLKKGESAIDVAKRTRLVSLNASVCTNIATFGFTPDLYPPTGAHISCHQDLFAQWFVSPAGGTIDTVFWLHTGTVGAQDSLVYLRIHKSNIYPGHGPGYGEYPAPPTICWGYYINTNDLDGGVAAFPEDATDPEWFSTIQVSDTSAPPTFPPTGAEIWGLGGFPVSVHANSMNFAAMQDIGIPASVNVGDPFFFTLRVNGQHAAGTCG